MGLLRRIQSFLRGAAKCRRCGNVSCCRENRAKMARECPLSDCGLRGGRG